MVRGDFNPIFQGTYSSRIELKQRTREVERLLTTAEKLGVMLRWLAAPTDDTILWRAWEPMLFNQAHDLMSGVMTDQVYEDTIRGYDVSQQIASDEVQARLRAASTAIDTRGEGIPVVVWNMLGWPRTDIVVAQVGLSDNGMTDVSLVGPDGVAVPVQMLHAVRSRDGSLLQAEVAFVARDVPALGYSIYRVLPLQRPAASTPEPQDEPVLENEYYRLEFDPGSGAMTSLVAKSSPWNVLDGPGNVVAREEDRGDLWELYHNLESGFVTNKTPHAAPQAGQAVFSSEPTATRGAVSRGDVFSEFTVTHPFGGENQVHHDGPPGCWTAEDRHPHAGSSTTRSRSAIACCSPRRSTTASRITRFRSGPSSGRWGSSCLRRTGSIAATERGVAVLNRGLPGNNVASGTMMLSLARSTRIQAYGYGGGYEPGMSSDTGFEVGKELSFDYALVPHTGDWREAGVYRDGLEFNHPLLAHTAAVHAGVLPPRWGLLQVTPHNVVISALETWPGRHGGAAGLRSDGSADPSLPATVGPPHRG